VAFCSEAAQIIKRQIAVQEDFRALAGAGDPISEPMQEVLATVYGIPFVDSELDEHFDEREVDRVAYNLWVLAKMPPGGHGPFRAEAVRLISSRGKRDRDT
jgi:hypothetical protein